MLNQKRKQFITLLASLAILLAQFGVVMHAADHPFHQEEIQCLSFQSAEQDKHCLNVIPAAIINIALFSDVDASSDEILLSQFNLNYLSRAPPATTI